MITKGGFVAGTFLNGVDMHISRPISLNFLRISRPDKHQQM
jgi:hypothetical protein